MMRFPLRLLLLCSAFLCATPLAWAQADPSSVFLRAYTEFQTGERLERENSPADALVRYRNGLNLLDEISRDYPDWQPAVVQFRQRRILEAVDRLESSGVQSLPGMSEDVFLEGSLPQPDLPPVTPRVSLPPATGILPGSTPQAAVPPAAPSADTQRMARELQELREQRDKLGAELRSALRELDQTRVTVVELRHELALAKTAAEAAASAPASPEALEELRKEFSDKFEQMAEELEENRAQRLVLEDENERLLAKLEQASSYISSSDEIRNSLDEERKEFAAEAASLRADRDKIQDELSGALTELASSQERLEEIERLASENEELKQTIEAGKSELETAKLQLAEAEAKLAEVSPPEELLARAEELEKQAEEQASRIAELEEQGATRTTELEELNQEKQLLAEARSAADQELESSRSQMQEMLREKEAAVTQAEERLLEIARLSEKNEELLERIRINEEQIENSTDLADRNAALMAQLEESRTRITELEAAKDGDGESSEQISALQTELNSLNDRLFGLRMEISSRDSRIVELERQLDETAGQLAELRINPAASPEEQEMVAENELLRGIIMRQLREQARRDQAKRLIVEEIDRLQVRSDGLRQQLDVLAAPMELSEEERSLFRTPMTLADEGEGTLQLGIAVTKPAESNEGETSAPPSAQEAQAVPPGTLESLPKPMQELAREGQEAFERGDLIAAEQFFQGIVDVMPDNAYALSRLAVVQFDAGKTRAAEIALERALEIRPDDPFSHAILGIVYYRQGKLDDAEKKLRRSVELEPDGPRNLNYLGIVLSEKGDTDGAEKALQDALTIDPNYAEAHFNLAVVYATQSPPSLEMARKHYASALQLGTEPDRALDRLLQQQAQP